jgi:hypothetical protein
MASKFENLTEFPGVLFPHSHLPENTIKKILSFFGPLTIFQPWFMERPIFVSDPERFEAVRVVNPPENLKPGEEFKVLLAEFHTWIRHNQDKGYTEFLKATQETDLSEESTWEIRAMLRKMGGETSIPKENHSLRWHLILHLAQEVEEQRMEADSILSNLKEKDTPLKGIVEESEEIEGMFQDLPPFESESAVDEYHIRQVLEAWFALFGGYLKGDELLITANRHVMDYITELWKELTGEKGVTSIPTFQFKIPDLSHQTLENLVKIKKEYFNDGKFGDLKRHILDFGIKPTNKLSTVEKLSTEVEASCPWELAKGRLNIVLKYLYSTDDNKELDEDRVLPHLINKTIVLVERASHNE